MDEKKVASELIRLSKMLTSDLTLTEQFEKVENVFGKMKKIVSEADKTTGYSQQEIRKFRDLVRQLSDAKSDFEEEFYRLEKAMNKMLPLSDDMTWRRNR